MQRLVYTRKQTAAGHRRASLSIAAREIFECLVLHEENAGIASGLAFRGLKNRASTPKTPLSTTLLLAITIKH
jgi:hypothetical protein